MSATPTIPGTPLPQMVIRSRRALEASYAELRSHTATYASTPAQDCPARRDQQAIRRMGGTADARRQLWSRGFRTVQITTANAEDHISSTIALLRGPDIPLFAHTTLARAACEATALVCYLTDLDISVEERLLRIGASLHHATEDQLKGAQQLPEGSAAARAGVDAACQQRLKELDDHLDASGMEVVKGKLVLRSSTLSVPLAPKISLLVQEVFAHRPTWYRMFSGTAHSSEWALISGVPASQSNGDLVFQPDLLELGAASLLELDAIAALDRRYARMFGHDPEPAAKKHRQRSTAVDIGMLDAWRGHI